MGRESYSSAEMQSMYSAAPTTDWAELWRLRDFIFKQSLTGLKSEFSFS